MRSYGKIVDAVAGLIAVGAGLYLLGTDAAADNSIFNPLLHGLGLYMLARGIWMVRHAGRQEDIVDRLDTLVELNALEHTRSTGSTYPAHPSES